MAHSPAGASPACPSRPEPGLERRLAPGALEEDERDFPALVPPALRGKREVRHREHLGDPPAPAAPRRLPPPNAPRGLPASPALPGPPFLPRWRKAVSSARPTPVLCAARALLANPLGGSPVPRGAARPNRGRTRVREPSGGLRPSRCRRGPAQHPGPPEFGTRTLPSALDPALPLLPTGLNCPPENGSEIHFIAGHRICEKVDLSGAEAGRKRAANLGLWPRRQARVERAEPGGRTWQGAARPSPPRPPTPPHPPSVPVATGSQAQELGSCNMG
ncbi:basic salivary proline-rich protein 4-like [Meles meles]|uniref:basic salivary proline-rich protein 4-like n=1 Tax=Meles meles TaxID=9662 RepID=UPI001E69D16C|nr:basic salivary proline-rich protein 4-like [Meles meles]